MNKTEAAYADNLEMKKKAGVIIDWKFESIKFRLAKKTFYTPDFMVINTNNIEFIEVKGFWRDDARVKIKVARELFPWFVWTAVQVHRGGWKYEEF
jgi:predicted nuclease of restriction endonuclease-like RecB superfamily